MPPDQPSDTPGDPPVDPPVDTSAERPVDPPTDRPADPPTDRRADPPATSPADPPADSSAGQVAQPPVKGNIRNAVQAIGLVAGVVVFNLALYVTILFLVRNGTIPAEPFFPALVLFLSFSLSIGIILIVALGETIDLRNSTNPLIRTIGATPVMVIVASVFAVITAFSPISNKIIGSDTGQRLMLVNAGVTCSTTTKNDSPQATHLLTVISSKDEEYIRKVKDFLQPEALKENKDVKNPDITFVTRVRDDSFFTTLNRYARSNQVGAPELLHDLSVDKKWVAYRADVLDPTQTTYVPIPTIYDKTHETRMFVIVKRKAETPQPELASLAASVAPSPTFEQRVLPLFQVEIEPKRPGEKSNLTNLDFKVFAEPEYLCWHVGGL